MISGFSEKVYKNYSGSSWELMDEAVVSALEASDIGRENIDGLITTYLPNQVFNLYWPDLVSGTVYYVL